MSGLTGYSDRINHAFAFAAKHHDQQVRKGTRLPYLTHPANVAVILTRYGCREDVVVAGISLVTNYRESFAAEVRAGGIDGLIKTLQAKNQAPLPVKPAK